MEQKYVILCMHFLAANLSFRTCGSAEILAFSIAFMKLCVFKLASKGRKSTS